MNFNAVTILAIVGGAVTIVALFKPSVQLVAVGAFLVAVAVVVLASGK